MIIGGFKPDSLLQSTTTQASNFGNVFLQTQQEVRAPKKIQQRPKPTFRPQPEPLPTTTTTTTTRRRPVVTTTFRPPPTTTFSRFWC